MDGRGLKARAPLPRRVRLRAPGRTLPGELGDARRADRSIVTVAAVVIVLVVGLLVWAIADVLLLLFAGVLFAVFLSGLTDALRKASGLPEPLSLAAVLLALGAVLGLGGIFLGAELANQLEQLGPRLGEAWGEMLKVLREYAWARTLLSEQNIRAVMANNENWLIHLSGAFSTTLGAVVGLLIVIFIGLYAAAAPHTYRRGLLRLFPPPARDRAANVLDELTDTLRWWLIGTFAKMTMVGVSVTIGLLLLDVPLALALGLIAFVLDFVPYLGPVLAAVPAVLVAIALGPEALLHVALLYLGVQTAENYLVAPLVDERSVQLPPALAIGAQVLFGGLLGALGVVFATPLAASAMVLVNTLYVEDDEIPVRRVVRAPPNL